MNHTVKKRVEESSAQNRLNADDRRGSFRGLDIISKVAYFGGFKLLDKIS